MVVEGGLKKSESQKRKRENKKKSVTQNRKQRKKKDVEKSDMLSIAFYHFMEVHME